MAYRSAGKRTPPVSQYSRRVSNGRPERSGPDRPNGSFVRPGERAVVVATESTKELRDLARLARDFELVEAYLDRYLAGDIEGDEAYASPLDAMWMTAVIFYARAFSNGVRHAAKPELVDTSTDEAKIHKYVLDVRNKYSRIPSMDLRTSTSSRS